MLPGTIRKVPHMYVLVTNSRQYNHDIAENPRLPRPSELIFTIIKHRSRVPPSYGSMAARKIRKAGRHLNAPIYDL